MSAFAGWATGNLAGILAGNVKSMIQGGLIFALLGAGGQAVYTKLDESRAERMADLEENPVEKKEPVSLVDSFLGSKWSPMRKMSPGEYEERMKERILKVEVERELVKDEIARLKAQLALEKASEANEDKAVAAAVASEAAEKKP